MSQTGYKKNAYSFQLVLSFLSAGNVPIINSAKKVVPDTITVGPNQQKVMYTIIWDSGKKQNYMTVLPKSLDYDSLVKTISKHILNDPTTNKEKVKLHISKHDCSPTVKARDSTETPTQVIKRRKIAKPLPSNSNLVRAAKKSIHKPAPTLDCVYNNIRGKPNFFVAFYLVK